MADRTPLTTAPGRVKIDPNRLAAAQPPTPRVTLKKPPELYKWTGSVFELYSRNWVRRNFWRVREVVGSEEDALQECAITFLRCIRYYQHTVNNPAWMMSLFKQALARDWHDLATKDDRVRSVPPPADEEGLDFNSGYLSALLSSGSAELGRFLSAIATAPAELVGLLLVGSEELAKAAPEDKAPLLARMDQRVRRLLGIKDSAAAVVSELHELLS